MACSNCLELFSKLDSRTPRILPCSHTFCSDCLLKTQKCPDCEICWNFDFVEKIPVNLCVDCHSHKPVQMCQFHKEFCGEEHEATHQCVDCFEYLCQNIASSHSKTIQTKTHKVRSLSDGLHLNTSQYLCPIHHKKFELFDQDCQIVICSLCALRSHKAHNLTFLEDLNLPEISDTLQVHLSFAESRITELNQVESQIESSISALDESRARTLAVVKSSFQTLMDSLVTRQQELERELSERHKSKRFVLTDQLDRTRLLRDNLRTALSQAQANQPTPPLNPEPELAPLPNANPEPELAPPPNLQPELAPHPNANPEPELAPPPNLQPELAPLPNPEQANLEPELAPPPNPEPELVPTSVSLKLSVIEEIETPSSSKRCIKFDSHLNQFIQYAQSVSTLIGVLSSTDPSVFPMSPLGGSSICFSNSTENCKSQVELEEALRVFLLQKTEEFARCGVFVELELGSAIRSSASGVGLRYSSIGHPTTVRLQIRDALGSNIKKRDSYGRWSIEFGSTRQPVMIQRSNRNHLFFQYTLLESESSFRPNLPISILCDGTPIQGSPFSVRLSRFGREKLTYLGMIQDASYQPTSMIVFQDHIFVNFLHSGKSKVFRVSDLGLFGEPKYKENYYSYNRYETREVSYTVLRSNLNSLSIISRNGLEFCTYSSSSISITKSFSSISGAIDFLASGSYFYVLTSKSVCIYKTDSPSTPVIGPFGDFSSASCFRLYQDELFVCDPAAHRIIVLSVANSNVVTAIGTTKGSAHGQFFSPSGLAIVENELFVSDTGNHRIQVFNLETFEYLRSFGSLGSAQGYFDSPKGLCYHENRLYVADSGNNRVQVFNFAM